ncbi:hypothetical protein AB0P00_15925 [Microbacterium sp. NPDC077057]|uniref:hypothetical protein n=1 Tax=Microbacterium sp. NPDC077057 TaxID=3154763 RepID=UPI003431DC01
MPTEHYDSLSNEQQDHLFYALHDAREAARERWLMDLGSALPSSVEVAIVEQYAEQLKDEAASRSAA